MLRDEKLNASREKITRINENTFREGNRGQGNSVASTEKINCRISKLRVSESEVTGISLPRNLIEVLRTERRETPLPGIRNRNKNRGNFLRKLALAGRQGSLILRNVSEQEDRATRNRGGGCSFDS